MGHPEHWLPLERMEARVGIEPTHKGFADLSLTAWVPRHLEQICNAGAGMETSLASATFRVLQSTLLSQGKATGAGDGT